MKIQILSEEMASRIAAGEVVERPASVVKELVENALDAGASEISIQVERSGTALIRVSDNGEGMAAEDLSLAVERHSTSKIRNEDDLFRIATLGFRGEALPSISSVSQLEIVSRQRSQPAAHRIGVAGGRKEALRASAGPVGTTVAVRDLFFNTPARRKFLKSPATELSHICDTVNRIALAHSAVHFHLQHDGRNVAQYVAVRDSRDRLRQVLGPNVAAHLASFASSSGGLSIAGYLSSVPASYPNARYLFTFVNRRYVRDKVLTHAIMRGYDTLLMKGQYPAVVLFLEVPYDEVDVNVHPAKFEVRFRRQNDVHETVVQAIAAALKGQRDSSVSAQAAVARPESSFVLDPRLAYGSPESAELEAPPLHPSFPGSLSSGAVQSGFFSSMRVLGQILGCYLVCASADGLSLIDQHAAHERIVFEKLRRQLNNGEAATQRLLIPQAVELPAGELLLLESKLDLLKRFGFILEPFGPTGYAITAAPALLPEGDYVELVGQMVAELAEVDNSEKPREHLEERLATIACHGVIRAHRRLDAHEIAALLADLDQTEHATQCPHGRPVLIEFSRYDLDRLFKRVV